MTAKTITTCRLCGSDNLVLALELEPAPLGDDFVTSAQLSKPQPEYTLNLMLCQQCGQVQLSNVVAPDEIYRDYTYRTSVSHGLVKHFQDYADSVLRRFPEGRKLFIVEIGSNEGAMLRYFQSRGHRVLGIDPAQAIADGATQDGIPTLPFYFSADLTRQIRTEHGPADIVIANNVLANIEDLDDVAEGVKALLAPDGVFVFETSYLRDVVNGALLDTIFSEHISYFSVKPMRPFFERHGLQLIDAEHTAPKGGSLRGTVQLAGGPRNVSASVSVMALNEFSDQLELRETYHKLGWRLAQLRAKLHDVIASVKARGGTIAAWGAADGPTTLIYQFGLGPYLEYILDDNPVKIGTYSPGLHLPVLSPDILKTDPPDMLILLAWRYAAEIMAAHPEYGGRWVAPLPEVKVLE